MEHESSMAFVGGWVGGGFVGEWVSEGGEWMCGSGEW